MEPHLEKGNTPTNHQFFGFQLLISRGCKNSLLLATVTSLHLHFTPKVGLWHHRAQSLDLTMASCWQGNAWRQVGWRVVPGWKLEIWPKFVPDRCGHFLNLGFPLRNGWSVENRRYLGGYLFDLAFMWSLGLADVRISSWDWTRIFNTNKPSGRVCVCLSKVTTTTWRLLNPILC